MTYTTEQIREMLEKAEQAKPFTTECSYMEELRASAPSIIRYLVGEVERLDKARDWFANSRSEVISELFDTRAELQRLQEQNAKYERSIKDVLQLLGTPTMSYCPTQEIQELADIRYKASKQLQEALKQIEPTAHNKGE